MSNNEKIQAKLAIFAARGGYWSMVDLLRFYDEEMGIETADDEWYLFYIRRLKDSYERQLIVDKKEVKQIDLEDSIREINGEL